MKKLILLISLAIVSCGTTKVSWKEGESVDKRYSNFTLEIQNPPEGTGWYVWFSQFRTPTTMLEGSEGKIEHVSGTLYRIIPEADTKGETLHLNYKAKTLVNQCRAPEAFYLVRPGKRPVKLDVSYEFQPAEPKHSFEWSHVDVGVEDMIPRLKSVEKGEGETSVPAEWASVTTVEGKASGWYRITLADGKAALEAADADAEYWAGITLENIRESAGGAKVSEMVIEDWPDLPYRGLMLDVSRNFTKKEGILTLIDLLSRYKANVLHLHLGDDEGWRVEIDALPELTSYGAFRGLPVLNEDGTISEPDALQPTYSASLDRKDLSGTASGYYSHKDFVEILKYAAEHHIRVIPEFDTPGHSRAAIKAMEKRAELTGDTSCLLSEPQDTSKYVSVQDYTDNAINVALESTYKFVETVFDGLIALYAEAGVPLEVIHVGGDEVPEGAWIGSPACRKMMAENGWNSVDRLKDYYVGRVLDIAAAKGVKVAGWQELVQNLQPETAAKMAAGLGFTNVWTVSHGREELPYQFANQGLPVVISSAPNAYLDFAYNDSKLERGHNWGGFVDERRTFSLLPYSMYRSVRWDDHGKIKKIANAPDGKTPLLAKENILGVQGQLWSETIRSFDHVTYYIFPKALGLFERGWNVSPVWENTTVSDDPSFTEDFNKFYSIINDKELPYYQKIGISYHTN
ncbi:MAG: family 20 glycosylhydrolase [Bacteroidales bacterium]|nr:family 20 glycosylhydrolase [Bacteroidales bacterium]